jgi:hypothetical protein
MRSVMDKGFFDGCDLALLESIRKEPGIEEQSL